MTYDWIGENHIKKSYPKKLKKNSENQSQIAACEQKSTSKKANLCSNPVFSHYFKVRAKKFHASKPIASSLHCLFRRDQKHSWQIARSLKTDL